MGKRLAKRYTRLVLEKRIVFDAAAVQTATEVNDVADAAQTDSLVASLNEPQDATESEALFDILTAPAVSQSDVDRSVLIVDSRVENFEQLLVNLAPDTDVFVLDANQDGVQQIDAILANYENLSSLQILSHADDASLILGNTILNNANIDSYADTLSSWGNALSDSGDILLFGCDVANGVDGLDFIQSLADYTRADVAASIDDTGAAALGGDWDLEAQTGTIEADSVLSEQATAEFDTVLATISFDGGAGTAFWDDAANWSGDVVPSINDDVLLNGVTVTIRDTQIISSLSLINSSLTIDTTADLSIANNGGLIDATSSLNGSGVLQIDNGSFDVQGSNTFNGDFILGGNQTPGIVNITGDFDNLSTLTVTNSVDATIESEIFIVQDSTTITGGSSLAFSDVNLPGSDISLGSDLFIDSGMLDVQSSNPLSLNNISQTGGTISTNSSSIALFGTYDWFGGTLSLNGLSFDVDTNATVNIDMANVLLDGGDFQNNGTVNLNSTGILSVVNTAIFRNVGTVNFNGGAIDLFDASDLVNNTLGQFRLASPVSAVITTSDGTGGTFTNGGSFDLFDDMATASFAVDVVNNGSFYLGGSENSAQVLTFAGNFDTSSGNIYGNGSLDLTAATVTGVGIISPGINGTAQQGQLELGLGQLSVIGDLFLDAGSQLDIDLDSGLQSDVLSVVGSVFLDGTLNINFLNNVTPQMGDAFLIFSVITLQGNQVNTLIDNGINIVAPTGYQFTTNITNNGTVLELVTISVPANAVDDNLSVNEDSTLTITSNDLLANDANTAFITGATTPANGTLVLDQQTGNYTYTPNPNFNGTDTFTYTADDGQGNLTTATVTITVNPVADTVTWTNATGDNRWETAGNWDIGFAPQDGDDVIVNDVNGSIIFSNASGTLTLNSLTSSEDDFRITGGRLLLGDDVLDTSSFAAGTNVTLSAGELGGLGSTTVDGSLDFRRGLLSGSLTINSGATLISTNGIAASEITGTLNNAGTIQIGNGFTRLNDGGVINNSGVIDFVTNGDLTNTSGTATLNNTGTIQKTAGTGVSLLDASGGAGFTFSGSGVVDAQTGSIGVSGPANYLSGFSTSGVNGGNSLGLYNGVHTFATGSTFSDGVFDFRRGTLAGELNIAANATLVSTNGIAASSITATLNNAGTFQIGSGFTRLNDGGVINNSGVIDFVTNGDLTNTSGTATLNNTGTIQKTAGTGVSLLDASGGAGFTFSGTGVVDAQTGSIGVSGPANYLSGFSTSGVNGGNSLGLYDGVHTFATGSTFSDGVFDFRRGTLAGELNIAANATLVSTNGIAASSITATLNNAGTFQIGSGFTRLNDGGVINNSGVIDFVTDGDLTNTSGAATLNNTGTIQKTSGTGVSFITNGTTFANNGGIIDAQTGTLQLPASVTSTGYDLRGNGTINLNGTTAPIVDINPGNAIAGRLAVTGDIDFDSTTRFTVEIGGANPAIDYDQLFLSGTINFNGGNIDVSLLNGYESQLTTGQVFTIATYASSTGSVSNLTVNAPQNLVFRLNDTGTALQLIVDNTAPAATADSFVVHTGTTLTVDAANGVLANDADVDGDTLSATLLGAMPPTLLSTIDLTNIGETSLDGMELDPVTGNLLLVSDGNLYEVTQQGVLVNTFTLALVDAQANPPELTGVTIDPVTGNILVTNSVAATREGGIYAFDRAGNNLGLFLTIDTPSGDPDGISVDPVSGNIFVADDTDQHIYEFDRSGNLINTIHTDDVLEQFDSPEGVAFDPNTGNLFVADEGSFGTSTIYILTRDGRLLTSFDTTQFGVTDPEGLYFDAANNQLYILNDDAPLSVAIVDVSNQLPVAQNGTVSLNTDGSFTYTPSYGFTGVDSFSYNVSDGNGGTDTAIVNITVSNATPVAINDSYSVLSGNTLNGDLLSNDSDADGDTLNANIFTSIDLSGLPSVYNGVAFDPVSGNFFMVDGDSTIVEVSPQGQLLNSFTTSFITIDGITYDPVTGNLLVVESRTATNGGGVYQFDRSGVNLGLIITIDAPSDDPDGIAVNAATGNIFIADHSNTSIFEFDRSGNLINTISTTGILSTFDGPQGVTVDPATGNIFVADDGTSRVFILSSSGSVITSFDTTPLGITDPEGISFDAATGRLFILDEVSSASMAVVYMGNTFATQQGGTVNINPDGTFSYVSVNGFVGTDSFTYLASDGNGASAVATANINVLFNNAPVTADDRTIINIDGSRTLDILANDFDPEGDALTLVSVDQPLFGSVFINQDNTVTYTPDEAFTGIDAFTYTVSDDAGNESTATVTVVTDTLGGIRNNQGFFDNDQGPNDDNEPVTNHEFDAIDLGFNVNFFGDVFSQVFVNTNGNITFGNSFSDFTPFDLSQGNGLMTSIIAPFFADVDTNNPDSNTVTYGFDTIDGRNAFAATWYRVGFFGGADIGSFNNFQVVLIDRSDIEAGAFDIEFNYGRIDWEAGTADNGDAFGLGGESARVGFTNGTGVPGTFVEIPGSGVNGAFLDSNQATGLAAVGRIGFEVRAGLVTALNSNPVAADDTVITDSVTTASFNVLSNDTDPDEESISILSFTQPANGVLIDEGNGNFSYTPNEGFSGVDAFTYTITDGAGGSDIAVVSINVLPVEDVNVRTGDTQTTDIFTGNVSFTQGANGTVVQNIDPITGDSTFTYQANPNFRGTDSFTVTTTINSVSFTQTINVTVADVFTQSWTGQAGDGDWSNPNNWDLGLTPADGDSVFIPDGADTIVFATGNNIVLDSLVLSDTLIVQSGSIEVLGTDGMGGTVDTIIQNNGVLDVAAGQTFIVSGGDFINNGTIFGKGTLDVTQATSFVNNGILSPGNSPGSLTINGDLTQTTSGTIVLEIAGLTPGTQYDQLIVNGTATLNGTVNVVLLNGFVLPANGNFQLLTATSIIGSPSINTPAGVTFDIFTGNTTSTPLGGFTGTGTFTFGPTSTGTGGYISISSPSYTYEPIQVASTDTTVTPIVYRTDAEWTGVIDDLTAALVDDGTSDDALVAEFEALLESDPTAAGESLTEYELRLEQQLELAISQFSKEQLAVLDILLQTPDTLSCR